MEQTKYNVGDYVKGPEGKGLIIKIAPEKVNGKTVYIVCCDNMGRKLSYTANELKLISPANTKKPPKYKVGDRAIMSNGVKCIVYSIGPRHPEFGYQYTVISLQSLSTSKNNPECCSKYTEYETSLRPAQSEVVRGNESGL
jgi:hypothetical protein